MNLELPGLYPEGYVVVVLVEDYDPRVTSPGTELISVLVRGAHLDQPEPATTEARSARPTRGGSGG